MKRMLIFAVIILLEIFFAGGAFSAAYDATGTWSYSTTNNWVNPGNAGCSADPNETDTAVLTQTGNSFTLVIEGHTATGIVSGQTYTCSYSYWEDGGTTTAGITFTLFSNTSGSGTSTWYWTDEVYWCEGGNTFSVTKSSVEETGLWSDATDVGDGWKYLDWFGYFWVDEISTWIYHYEHGWAYPFGESTSDIWFYTIDKDWFWTSDTVYPWIYVLKGGLWTWDIWD